MSALRGVGDRWLAGEAIDGVRHGPGARVAFAAGPRAGERATVELLVVVAPEPAYQVRTADGAVVRVRQSSLRADG